MGAPAVDAAGDGPELCRDVCAVEPPRAAAGRVPGRRGARPFPGRGAPGRSVGDRAPGAVHLRGVGERRAAGVGDGAVRPAGADPGRGLSGRGGAVVRRAAAAGGGAADRPRRSGDHGAGGERVRQLRHRRGLPAPGHGAARRVRCERSAVHLRRAGGPHAHGRFGARSAGHGQLRFGGARGVPGAAPSSERGPVDVHGVLVRMVRALGRAARRTGSGAGRRRAAGDPGVRGVGEHLHGARGDELRRVGGRQPLGAAPGPGPAADGDVVRLRRADRRVRPGHGEVPPVPGASRPVRGRAAARAAAGARRSGSGAGGADRVGAPDRRDGGAG